MISERKLYEKTVLLVFEGGLLNTIFCPYQFCILKRSVRNKSINKNLNLK